MRATQPLLGTSGDLLPRCTVNGLTNCPVYCDCSPVLSRTSMLASIRYHIEYILQDCAASVELRRFKLCDYNISSAISARCFNLHVRYSNKWGEPMFSGVV